MYTENLCQVILMCYVEFYFCENSWTIIVLLHQHAATAEGPKLFKGPASYIVNVQPNRPCLHGADI